MCAAGVGGIPLIRDRHPSPIDDLQRGGQDSREFYSFPLVSFIIFATWQLASVPQIAHTPAYCHTTSPRLISRWYLPYAETVYAWEMNKRYESLDFSFNTKLLKTNNMDIVTAGQELFQCELHIYIVDKRYNKCICVVLSYIGLYILYSPKMIAIKQ